MYTLYKEFTNEKKRQIGYIRQKELEDSMNISVRAVQNQHFSEEIQNLREGSETVIKSSTVRTLHPFLDEKGILRVGGRLRNSDLKFNEKHPILLPFKHKFTELVFQEEHLRLRHAPPLFLLSSVRQEFWAIKGPILAKRIVNKCVICRKFNRQSSSQIMGSLPENRVKSSHPFSQCGIDYTGPIHIKSSKRKNSAITKAYLCLFICFVTKAVHLELVTNLTAQDFLSALQRFVARRGYPSTLHSDNSKTFVGAKNILINMFNDILSSSDVANYFSRNKIKWRFNAPYSPHLGGLWEAAIKNFKRYFMVITKSRMFSLEQAQTIIIHIEGILNSRPLTALSSDPHDLEPLTPGHFLIGRPIMSLPINFSNKNELRNSGTLVNRWKIVHQKVQEFWTRWSVEYLQTLQRSAKWHEDLCNLKEGSLVMVKSTKTHPMCWPMARVLELKQGTDGKARVAVIRTKQGVSSRAITELCALPVD